MWHVYNYVHVLWVCGEFYQLYVYIYQWFSPVFFYICLQILSPIDIETRKSVG